MIQGRFGCVMLVVWAVVVVGCQATPKVAAIPDRQATDAKQATDAGTAASEPGAATELDSAADNGAANAATTKAQLAAADGGESLSPPGLNLPDEVLDRLGQRDSLRSQEERAAAQHYYEVGKQFFDQLDYQRAYDNLQRAVKLDPRNKAAVDLYYRTGAILGVRQDELKANLERFSAEQKVKVQLMQQEMLRFFEAGETAFGANAFDEAIRNLERAIEIIAWSPYQIDTASYRPRAERMLAEAKRKQLYSELEQRNVLEQQAIDKARDEEQRKHEMDTRRLGRMLKQTGDLLRSQRYPQAVEMATRVLKLDPRNVYAKKYLEYARQGVHTLTNAGIYERTQEEEWMRRHNVQAKAVPMEGEYLTFPEDWLDRTRFREAGVGEDLSEEPYWQRHYRRVLRDRKITLGLPNVSLDSAVMVLVNVSGLNFVVSQEVDAGSITINVNLKDITIENALKIILEQAELTYVFADEAIQIVPPGTMPGAVEFVVYDVSDILYKIRDFTAPRITLPADERTEGAGGGGPSLVFGGGDDEEDAGEPLSGESMVEIIQGATGGDEAWEEPNSIESHRGQLLVTGGRELHEKVRDVLKALRQNNGLFVHIETRFVDVENDMLEDIGVDFRGLGTVAGFTNAGYPTAPIAMTPKVNKALQNLATNSGIDVDGDGTPDFDAGGTRDTSASPAVGNDNFAVRSQHIFGNLAGPLNGRRLGGGGGLTLQVANLDDFQFNAIIRAEAETSKVRRMTAPRVTAANRERVYVSVVTQRSYIKDWELISGGSGLVVVETPDPVVDTFQEGVALEVRPTISSDRKYVTLDMRPALSTLVGGSIATIIVNLGGLSATAIQVPIEVPQIQLDQAFTSVTVPDGGTALLGGFRQIRETKYESAVPFLDKVPFLNLLFKRKGWSPETRSIVILVTARIVSVRDEERRLFNDQ